jgi:hypothetical protein
MGVHPGFADLLVISEGRVLFLEVKSAKGRLRPEQDALRETVLAQGFGWALARSVDDALAALPPGRVQGNGSYGLIWSTWARALRFAGSL